MHRLLYLLFNFNHLLPIMIVDIIMNNSGNAIADIDRVVGARKVESLAGEIAMITMDNGTHHRAKRIQDRKTSVLMKNVITENIQKGKIGISESIIVTSWSTQARFEPPQSA